MLAAFGASAADPAALATRFRAEVARLETRLAEYAGLQRELSERPETDDPTRPEFGWQLSLLNGLMSARARRDWCRIVAERLEQAARVTPSPPSGQRGRP